MTKRPSLVIDSPLRTPGLLGLGVSLFDPDLTHSLDGYLQAGGRLQSILRVTVVPVDAPGDGNIPAILGRYQVSKDGIRFVPLFPFERGLLYRATFDAQPLGRSDLSGVLTIEFSLPREQNALPTEVKHIFPSSEELPENLLRFYIHFSNPMQRGRVEAEISLLGPDGKPASDVLYRAPVELWDKSMLHLTILLDPGRLKRGVGPNRELGAPLKPGLVYTLAIGAGMTDISDRRLCKTVYKPFRVTSALREPIQVEQWKIVPPATGSRHPLLLLFPRPLDWGLLSHAITIVSACGQAIAGRVAIDQCERRWSFIPTLPWTPGFYHVCAASSLEDVCGNSVVAAFDRPLRSGNDLAYEAANHLIPFYLENLP